MLKDLNAKFAEVQREQCKTAGRRCSLKEVNAPISSNSDRHEDIGDVFKLEGTRRRNLATNTPLLLRLRRLGVTWSVAAPTGSLRSIWNANSKPQRSYSRNNNTVRSFLTRVAE